MASEMVERIAQALDDAEVEYRMELTRLVDGEITYTLYIQGDALEFGSTDDAYEHVRKVKNRVRALAVLKALREPNKGMLDAAYAAYDAYEEDPVPRSWCGLTSAFRAMFDHEIKLAEEPTDEH